MDSSGTTLISKSSNNKLHFKGPYLRQNWSLPDSIIYYITKTPSSSKGYQKLIQTCKYFFSKNPIIVCSDLTYYGDENEFVVEIEQNGNCINVDLNSFSQKFWFTNCLNSNGEAIIKNGNLISSIIPNIYQCDIKYLILCDQNLSWNEYLFLTSKIERIEIFESIVKYDDGTIAPQIELLAASNVQTFYTDLPDDNISSDFVTILLEIPHFSTLIELYLTNIPEKFDIETFYNYIKKNKNTHIVLDFGDLISEVYEDRLNEIIDEIIGIENRNYKCPIITYNGMNEQKYLKMRAIVFPYDR